MISAGSLDRKITIQQYVVTKDAIGGVILTYQNQYANVPAMVRTVGGKEKFHAESDRIISYDQERFTVRYIEGITTKHRIVFEGTNYNILKISELNRREGLEILAQIAQ